MVKESFTVAWKLSKTVAKEALAKKIGMLVAMSGDGFCPVRDGGYRVEQYFLQQNWSLIYLLVLLIVNFIRWGHV